MYYSEYLSLIKKEIQSPLLENSDYPVPTKYICLAISKLAETTPVVYQNKLKAKIRELITKQNKALNLRLTTLMLDNIEVNPHLTVDDIVLTKRIIFLDKLIASARKREAAASNKSLF